MYKNEWSRDQWISGEISVKINTDKLIQSKKDLPFGVYFYNCPQLKVSIKKSKIISRFKK